MIDRLKLLAWLSIGWFVFELSIAKGDDSQKPNVLLIMADDLGFSDLGCYGSEIQTPNLDRLAQNGIRFTQFYNTARCWPTRAALLTGYYPQQVKRDDLPGIKKGKRPSWAELLPERLKASGYRSYHSGKWHLDGMPVQNGFDKSYYLQDQGRFFYPQVHWKDDQKLPPVKKDAGYYATTAIAEHAIGCLKDHQQNHGDRPFFHYLAFTAPHFPLHALPEDIEKYDAVYKPGWDVIREQRWKKVQKLGIVDAKLSEIEYDLGPPYDFPEAIKKLGEGEINRPQRWELLSEKQKQFQTKKMAIHAAMIDRMDQEIGRVLQQLQSMDAMENTLILFLSDNGASAEIMVRTDGHDPEVPPGSGPSYECLGPGWSTVSNTPFRRHKTWVHEGGIRTPMIAHWPKSIGSAAEKLDASNSSPFRRIPAHVIDVVPTILEVAGASESSKRETSVGFPGKSLVRAFKADGQSAARSLWWSHEGNRAIRRDGYKLVAAKGEAWSLFDMSKDPTEQKNLAVQQPKRVRDLASRWLRLQESFIQLHKKKE